MHKTYIWKYVVFRSPKYAGKMQKWSIYVLNFHICAPISPCIFAEIAVYLVKKANEQKKVIQIIQTGVDPL